MGWLLKIYHTEGSRTLGEMVSHTGDSHIPVIMAWSAIQSLHKVCKVSSTQAVFTSNWVQWFFRGLDIFARTALLKISAPIKQFFVIFVQFVEVLDINFVMLFTVKHSTKVQPVLSTRLVFQWDGTPL